MTEPVDEADDVTAVAADDAVFEALAAGRATDADATVVLLAAWWDELETAAALPVRPRALGRSWSVRRRRTAAGAVATMLTLATSTGVAAAASGPTGPLGALHRALFGGASAVPAAASGAAWQARIRTALDDIAARTDAASSAGGITDAARARLVAALNRAAATVAAHRDAPASLRARVAQLRSAVAGLTPLAVPAPSASGDSRDGVRSDDATSGEGDRGGPSSGRSGSDDGGGGTSSDDGTSGSGGGGTSGTSGTSGSGGDSGTDGTDGTGGGTSGDDTGSIDTGGGSSSSGDG